jgi:hypothetical protein
MMGGNNILLLKVSRSQRQIKAQAVKEYVMLFAGVVAALISLGVYFSRGLQGHCKQYTDNIGGQFSPYLSRYNSIKETLPFAKQNWSNSKDGNFEQIVLPPSGSSSDIQSSQITQTTDAVITQVSENANSFFSSEAPGELKNIFAAIAIETNYNVGSRKSVVDDFSEVNLADDTLF